MTTYAAAPGDKLVPGAQGASTELFSRVNGFIAGCGEASAAVLIGIYKGTPPTPAQVTKLILQAVNGGQTVGRAAKGGQSTPENLSWLLAQNGVPVTGMDYRTALDTYAGVRPIEIGVNKAYAFGGNDSKVNGHYVTVVGKTHDGRYIVSDPNTDESTTGGYVIYSRQQFAAADPFWAGVPMAAVPGAGDAGGSSASTAGGSSNAGACRHQLDVAWGSICFDSTIGALERIALMAAGVAAIALAVHVFTHGNAGGVSSSVGTLRRGGGRLAAGLGGGLGAAGRSVARARAAKASASAGSGGGGGNAGGGGNGGSMGGGGGGGVGAKRPSAPRPRAGGSGKRGRRR